MRRAPDDDPVAGDVCAAARADQRRPREAGRHDRRVDPAAHRHPRAAHRRSGRGHVRPRQGGGAARPSSSAGLTPDDIGFIVVGTVTPDMMFPSTACLVQHKIGAQQRVGIRPQRRVLGVHLLADDREPDRGERRARSRAGRRRRRDVEHHRLHAIARPASSSATAPAPASCPPAGDGRRRDPRLRARDRRQRRPRAVHAGRRQPRPPSHETVDQRLHYVKQDGQTVFKFAVRKTEEICAARSSSATASQPADIDLFVSHQANRRIIQSATEKLGLDARQGHHQHRSLRQHDRRHDPAGAERRRLFAAASRRATSSCWRRSAPGSRSAPCCSAGVSDPPGSSPP